MEHKRPFVSFSSESSPVSTDRKREPLLPYSEIVSEKMAVKLRNPLSHCLYKRVFIWTALSLLMVAFVLFGKHDGKIGDVTQNHIPLSNDVPAVKVDGSNAEQFYEGEEDEDETAMDEAQRIIDAARNGQGESQVQVAPTKNSGKHPSGEQKDGGDQNNEGTSEDPKDDSEQSSKKQLPSSGKSSKGSKYNSGDEYGDDDSYAEYEEKQDGEGIPEYDQHAEESEMKLLLEGENTEQLKQELENLKRMPWLRFPQ